MEYRQLGRTGLEVSVLGFGCGAVGGLMVRGAAADQIRAVGRAAEAGINYFDTAFMYGEGVSETNLGRALRQVGAQVKVGTKVVLTAADMDDVEAAVQRAAEDSLRRLQLERVDLFQLHNSLGPVRDAARRLCGPEDVAAAARGFQKLVEQGKIGHWGINGLGQTETLLAALDSGAQTIQSCFNLLNPSAGWAVPEGFPFQDYGRLIDRAAERGMGVIAIRVLAGGALSGSAARHPIAAASVGPIASGRDYAEDVERAGYFKGLVEGGFAEDPVEAAFRFAFSKKEVATALIGASSLEQLEHGIACAEKGPLPETALETLAAVWAEF